jgi:hypothetical protein
MLVSAAEGDGGIAKNAGAQNLSSFAIPSGSGCRASTAWTILRATLKQYGIHAESDEEQIITLRGAEECQSGFEAASMDLSTALNESTNRDGHS